jgi:hypothetical protein
LRPCDFLGNELLQVRLVEWLGLDVTYWTDVDLPQHPGRLLADRALVSLGHDEYWSTRMRQGAEAARGPRGQPGLPGRQRRLPTHSVRPSPAGPDRQEVNFKPWSIGEGPAWKVDPAQVTTDWRRPPLNDPESQLLAVFVFLVGLRSALTAVAV